MSKFKWREPIALTGDLVLYKDRHGRTVEGKVIILETTYGLPRMRGHGEARHSYGILRRGAKRKDWITDDQIRKVIC